MTKPKKYIWEMVSAAMCIALGVVLPLAFHSIPNAASILLPMHIPVLLCGLLCGPAYGLACGILVPLLSAMITGMPAPAYLPSMICELATYGFVAGLLIVIVRSGSHWANTYIALVGAMLIGRLVYGAVNAFIFRVGSYSLYLWLTASFVTALPGIIIQLVLLPLIVVALRKAKLAAQP